MTVIDVHQLARRFGQVEAVKGVNFTVAEGEVFGFLGPNGAGKTTTIGAPPLSGVPNGQGPARPGGAE